MQYVGTLSWSMVPLALGQAPAVRHTPSAHRERERRDDPKQELAREWPASATALPVTRAARVEVRPLEQDWPHIIRRCMDGDSGAWAEMVRTHQKRVYGLCYRFTGNPSDAEDLTQDVFLKIYSNLGSFDAARGSLPVWITTMTRNLLVDNFRRTRNLRATSSLDDGWDQTEELKPVECRAARGSDSERSTRH
jgi:RNA polymerase sigma-70 factor (ECF subfamily)